MPSNILVSDAGYAPVNGSYTYRGTANGRGVWTLLGQSDDLVDFFYSIYWDGGVFGWNLLDSSEAAYQSSTDTANPWDATWNNDPGFGEPPPTVTEVASGAAIPVLMNQYRHRKA